MDLEDAVAPDSKLAARAMVVEKIRKGGYGHREIIVRVNSLTSAWGCDDVAVRINEGLIGRTRGSHRC